MRMNDERKSNILHDTVPKSYRLPEPPPASLVEEQARRLAADEANDE